MSSSVTISHKLEVKETDRNNQTDIKSRQEIRVPHYSKNHPLIPRFYVQPWRQDIQNRETIIHNAKKGNLPTFEHDDCLYLNKREQLKYNVQNRSQVDQRYQLPSRFEMMNPKFHEATQRYHSSMMARYCKE